MGHRIHLDDNAQYRIQVQGIISPRWREYYQGFTISVTNARDRSVTTLSGEVQDQAALLGIINHLNQMGYALISVQCQSSQE